MSEAWSSCTVTEPEWSPKGRAEALAHVQVGSLTCDRCGQRGALVEIPVEQIAHDRVDWMAHGYPKRFSVRQYRCLACASVELVTADIRKSLPKDDEAAATQKFAGLRLIPREVPRT